LPSPRRVPSPKKKKQCLFPDTYTREKLKGNI
jgi:hypothetical protein